jgi:DNA modification methylase
MGEKELAIDEIIWREDLYPRFEPVPARIQQYAECIELLPPIEVNQRNELIDGYHRWTAHKKAELKTIKVIVTETESDAELDWLMAERNADGKIQLSQEEKKSKALRWFVDLDSDQQAIAGCLKVSLRTVQRWLSRKTKDLKAERDRKIAEMWLAMYKEEEIAETVGLDQSTVNRQVKELCESDMWQKSIIFSDYKEPEWSPPLFSAWKKKSKTNKTSHFGNSEAMFLDYLLYMYTEPFDAVVDPFGGGGSTIDVCKQRLRRYWVSDRVPVPERRDIRQYDILDGPPPLHKRWSEVKLLYLDPPYWKQAEGEYSDDPQDLANMELDEFHATLIDFIEACADKMRAGARIAMLMQPTQWKAPDRDYPVDHIYAVRCGFEEASLALRYTRSFQIPYESQQYNAQQVEWAKENREVLEIGRTITVWEVIK